MTDDEQFRVEVIQKLDQANAPSREVIDQLMGYIQHWINHEGSGKAEIQLALCKALFGMDQATLVGVSSYVIMRLAGVMESEDLPEPDR